MKQKLIVYEGPDGTGKTTRSSRLSQAYPLLYRSLHTKRKDSAKQAEDAEFVDFLLNTLEPFDGSYLLDRHFASNIVYERFKQINKQKHCYSDAFASAQFALLESLYKAFDCTVTYFLPDKAYEYDGYSSKQYSQLIVLYLATALSDMRLHSGIATIRIQGVNPTWL